MQIYIKFILILLKATHQQRIFIYSTSNTNTTLGLLTLKFHRRRYTEKPYKILLSSWRSYYIIFYKSNLEFKWTFSLLLQIINGRLHVLICDIFDRIVILHQVYYLIREELGWTIILDIIWFYKYTTWGLLDYLFIHCAEVNSDFSHPIICRIILKEIYIKKK